MDISKAKSLIGIRMILLDKTGVLGYGFGWGLSTTELCVEAQGCYIQASARLLQKQLVRICST
jgi:hypothetical protein